MRKIRLIVFFVVFIFVISAGATLAAGLVPEGVENCIGAGDCFCRVLELVQKVTQFLMGLIGGLAFLMFIYGGALWIFSGAKPAFVDQGKKAMIYSVIGIVLSLGSYAIVNLILLAILGQSTGFGTAKIFEGKAWTDIECAQAPATPAATQTQTTTTPAVTTANCASFTVQADCEKETTAFKNQTTSATTMLPKCKWSPNVNFTNKCVINCQLFAYDKAGCSDQADTCKWASVGGVEQCNFPTKKLGDYCTDYAACPQWSYCEGTGDARRCVKQKSPGQECSGMILGNLECLSLDCVDKEGIGTGNICK